MEYQKPPLSLSDQVKLLVSRGLVVPDQDFAAATLQQHIQSHIIAFGLFLVITPCVPV
jgi:abortive infection bacteriophage resistance protein